MLSNICFRLTVVAFSVLFINNSSAALVSSAAMFDSSSSPHFSKEDQIEAAKARTSIYTCQIKQGIDMKLVRGMLISIDQDLHLLHEANKQDFVAENLFNKSLVLTYAHSGSLPTPTVESLELTLESATMGHVPAQDVVLKSLEWGRKEESFSEFLLKYNKKEIKKIDVFSKMLLRMKSSLLCEVITALRGFDSNQSGLDSRLVGITQMTKKLYSMDPEFCILIKEECAVELTQIEEMLGKILSEKNPISESLRQSAEKFWDAIDGRVDTEERKLERELNAEMLKKAGWK